ncbi:MAG: hypothetical protein FWC78_08515 [Defluviitaleaceae bacterium]|nr:hypothetical protein [Defluviitaleaceae bacterium]
MNDQKIHDEIDLNGLFDDYVDSEISDEDVAKIIAPVKDMINSGVFDKARPKARLMPRIIASVTVAAAATVGFIMFNPTTSDPVDYDPPDFGFDIIIDLDDPSVPLAAFRQIDLPSEIAAKIYQLQQYGELTLHLKGVNHQASIPASLIAGNILSFIGGSNAKYSLTANAQEDSTHLAYVIINDSDITLEF